MSRAPREKPFFTRPEKTSPPDPRPERNAFTIRSKSTLTLVARVLLSCHLDYDKAVDVMFPKDSIERKMQTSEYLQAHMGLNEEIEEQLKIPGLDDTSKKAYVEEMWRWLWSGDNELKQTAARLLGKALIPEKSDDKPATLPIRGIDKGLSEMFEGKLDSTEPAPIIPDEVN